MIRSALRRIPLAVLASAAVAAVPSSAAASDRPLPAAGAPAVPSPSVELPGATARAATAGGRWTVAGRPGAQAARIARAHGATALAIPGAYGVPVARARAFADALDAAGLLRFAEPNAPRERASAFEAAPTGWARATVVPATQPLPSKLPAIGVVDDLVDTSHPDVAANTRLLDPLRLDRVEGPHGTMVASAAAGVVNGAGVFGVLPGAPVVSYGVPTEFGCQESADGIATLADEDVGVIVLSYGSPVDCLLEYVAVSYALSRGTLVVAASGNEFQAGNPVLYPGAWPHVLSVGAHDKQLMPSFFSSANAAVDIAGPGEAVPLAIPLAFDDDGIVDGLTLADGTSFAAPVVAGAAAWVRGARPDLDAGQVADVLRRSAVDIGRVGYDSDTGFGRADVPRALAEKAPAADPLEPNDLVGFVDGELIGKDDKSIWSGKGTRKLRANVDAIEDPVDIYRVRVPGRSRVKVLLRPSFGDTDLLLYDGTADDLGERSKRRDASRRSGERTESVTYRNRSRRTRTMLVVAEIGTKARFAEGPYRLEVKRVKFR